LSYKSHKNITHTHEPSSSSSSSSSLSLGKRTRPDITGIVCARFPFVLLRVGLGQVVRVHVQFATGDVDIAGIVCARFPFVLLRVGLGQVVRVHVQLATGDVTSMCVHVQLATGVFMYS
jgi:hypothetical protein